MIIDFLEREILPVDIKNCICGNPSLFFYFLVLQKYFSRHSGQKGFTFKQVCEYIYSGVYGRHILIHQFHLESTFLASLANHVTLSRLIVVALASVNNSIWSIKPKWVYLKPFYVHIYRSNNQRMQIYICQWSFPYCTERLKPT